MTTNSDPQGAADQRAHDEWMDGEGTDCATTTGFWHAALAWERKRVTPPTPAGTEELAAARAVLIEEYREFVIATGLIKAISGPAWEPEEPRLGTYAAIIARHFQPLREELARVSKEQDGALEMLDTVARGFDVALARLLAGDRQGAERELKLAITHIDRKDFAGGSIAALRTENAVLRDQSKQALQELKTVHAYVQSVKNHIPIEIVAKVLNVESILSK